MSDNNDKSAGEESLAPQQTRIMDKWSYLLAWLGGCVSIGTFAMGSSLVGQLNMLQSVVAIAIGCFVIGVALTINGAAGHKYGIPFMVQARTAFGFAGTRFPGLIRAVPAVVWLLMGLSPAAVLCRKAYGPHAAQENTACHPWDHPAWHGTCMYPTLTVVRYIAPSGYEFIA